MTYELPEWALPIGCPIRVLNHCDEFTDCIAGHIFTSDGLTQYLVRSKEGSVVTRPCEYVETEVETLSRRIKEATESIEKMKAKLEELPLCGVSGGEYMGKVVTNGRS